ncbi:hypothetical protein TNCV_859161 [Trichonephila clavipes]|nr:hypothetical protein TNCV_859161 [Trichonephila clavipes]
MEAFRKCKQACVDALRQMPDHCPDEPFYRRALTELQDIEETMAIAVGDIDSYDPCTIPGCPHHEKTPSNSPIKFTQTTPENSRFGRRDSITSNENWSERTEQSSSTKTNTAGLGAISPSRICFADEFIAENSDLFRETIVAPNVYAAWARKLTTAKPADPDLQNIHLEGEGECGV